MTYNLTFPPSRRVGRRTRRLLPFIVEDTIKPHPYPAPVSSTFVSTLASHFIPPPPIYIPSRATLHTKQSTKTRSGHARFAGTRDDFYDHPPPRTTRAERAGPALTFFNITVNSCARIPTEYFCLETLFFWLPLSGVGGCCACVCTKTSLFDFSSYIFL